MFITFEGIDGSGKTTQIELLESYFAMRGYPVLKLREPGGTVFSEAIRELLLSKEFEIDSITELLLFDAARSHLVAQIIKPALDRGEIVLCDRFYDSTTAYQGYGRGIDLDQVMIINKIATKGLEPDITFFLDVDLNVSALRSKDKENDRIESSGNEFFLRVREGFEQIARNEPNRMVVINSESEKDETHKKIIEVLQQRFPELR